MDNLTTLGRITVKANELRRDRGAEYAKHWAKEKGYAIRWDSAGNIFIRDLLA